MKSRILGTFLMSAALMLGASKTAKLQTVSDAAIGTELHREIVAYAHCTVFDAVAYQVNDGRVSLSGVVTDPSKKKAMEDLARSIRGVTAVNDNIQALSNSPVDNRIRSEVAQAIYGNPVFDHYASEQQQPVRILVDHGRVTLQGVVQSDLEKKVAGLNAGTAGLRNGPVVNDLEVVPASRKS